MDHGFPGLYFGLEDVQTGTNKVAKRSRTRRLSPSGSPQASMSGHGPFHVRFLVRALSRTHSVPESNLALEIRNAKLAPLLTLKLHVHV